MKINKRKLLNNALSLLCLLLFPATIIAQCTLLPQEQFTTSTNFSTGTSTTTKFWSPNTCTIGGLLYFNTGGCTGGYVGKTGSWNNYFGCFLRTPAVNCTGNTYIILNFDISNSYFANHPNDKTRFYMWVDNGYKQASNIKINGTEVGYADINGLWLKFDQARTCVNVDVYFDLTTCSNLTNILFYIEPNCGYNDASMYSVLLDNISIKGELPQANAGADDTICESASVQMNASGGTSFTWSPAAGLSSASIANPLASPTVTTTYTVMATGTCGTATDAVTINVIPPPATPVITQIGNILYSNVPDGNQWYDILGPIDNATQDSLIPSITGYYYVVVTDSNGCHSDTSNQLYVVVTGIPASIAGVAFLNINPNPATDKITISSRHMPENITITVYDLTGRIMVDEKPLLPGSNDLDISGWAKGLYMIRAKSNQQTVFQNFIKR